MFDDGKNESLDDAVHSFVVKTKTSHLMEAVLRRCVQMNIFDFNVIYT